MSSSLLRSLRGFGATRTVKELRFRVLREWDGRFQASHTENIQVSRVAFRVRSVFGVTAQLVKHLGRVTFQTEMELFCQCDSLGF